ncbi:MAG: hypothetical protein H8D23_35325 [Candidatus Brocadiales bacterium]|nr:hypothetical protein [Candidatus Brocadiales bacterium]
MSYDVMTLSMQEFSKSQDADKPDRINRYMGGNRRHNHPYISGYWYLVLDAPSEIFTQSDTTSESMRRWFHSTAESFTPPSKTITKVDVPGMGGMASSYIAGQEITREFTVAFREYQSLPISTAIRTWANVMDPHLGRSPLKDYLPANYKGQCWAILCKPTLNRDHDNLTPWDVEQVYYMEGVFPTTIPDDAFATDIATNDVAQLSVTFSFDGGFHTKESKDVVEKAISVLEEIEHSDSDKSYEFAMKNMDNVQNSANGGSRVTGGAGSGGSGTSGSNGLIGNRQGPT